MSQTPQSDKRVPSQIWTLVFVLFAMMGGVITSHEDLGFVVAFFVVLAVLVFVGDHWLNGRNLEPAPIRHEDEQPRHHQ